MYYIKDVNLSSEAFLGIDEIYMRLTFDDMQSRWRNKSNSEAANQGEFWKMRRVRFLSVEADHRI